MIPVLDARAMRAADTAAIRSGISGEDLMENAAEAIADEAFRGAFRWRRVVVVSGPGNNGGDGLAAARLLATRGAAVRLFTLRAPEFFRGDAATNAARARSVGLEPVALDRPRAVPELASALADCDGIVDALFGTGLARPLGGLAARVVAAIDRSARPVLAADVPSGLSSDSGARLGTCVRADVTVALAAPKICHVTFPAREWCGEIRVADIGIPRADIERFGARLRLRLVEASDVRALVPPRRRDSHKGDFGRLAIVAGSRGKTGAAILAARGALRAGAGLVTVFCGESLESTVVAALPETMTRGLPEKDGAIAESAARVVLAALSDFDAVAVGPGLTTAPGTVAFLERLFATRLPLIADADALNAFAGRPAALAGRARVITPHPGEAARLLSCSTKGIQSDRTAAARRLARRARATAVLKGPATLVATPDGEVRVNPTGTPLLSTAGAGDVLSGMVGAYLARGLAPADAAVAAVWLHGAAGDRLTRRLGDAGLLTAELADAVPAARRRLLENGARKRARPR